MGLIKVSRAGILIQQNHDCRRRRDLLCPARQTAPSLVSIAILGTELRHEIRLHTSRPVSSQQSPSLIGGNQYSLHGIVRCEPLHIEENPQRIHHVIFPCRNGSAGDVIFQKNMLMFDLPLLNLDAMVIMKVQSGDITDTEATR